MSKRVITHSQALERIYDYMLTGMSYHGAKLLTGEKWDLCDTILQKPLEELPEYLASPFEEIRFAATLRFEEFERKR